MHECLPCLFPFYMTTLYKRIEALGEKRRISFILLAIQLFIVPCNKWFTFIVSEKCGENLGSENSSICS